MAETRIPKTIHRIWFGAPMPETFEQYGRTWQQLHPDWTMILWTEQNLPPLRNQAQFDASTWLPEKANIARYEILLEHGGLYVDCDLEPLRSVDSLLAGADFVVGEESPGYCNNAFIASTAGHPILHHLVDQLSERFEALDGEISPVRSGPYHLTRSVAIVGPTLAVPPRVLDRHLIYPTTFTQVDLRKRSSPDSFAVHDWNTGRIDSKSSRRRLGRQRRWKDRARKAAKKIVRYVGRMWHAVSIRLGRRPMTPAQYLGPTQLLVRTTEGFPILADPHDLTVTPELLLEGTHDPEFMRFLEREIRPGDVTVDVGANIGTFTIKMATLTGPTGRVVAFEPNPVCFALLEASLYMNRMRGLRADVRLEQQALGATSGFASLFAPVRHRGKGSFRRENAQQGPEDHDSYEHLEVPVQRLDEVLTDVAEIRLIKIDVEGFEVDVLEGMERLLAERRVRAIDIELNYRLTADRWPRLERCLREFRTRYDANFSAIAGDGSTRATSLEKALHSDGMQHLLIRFP